MSFTQLPDYLIDECELTLAERACVWFISRKTMGWGKRTDGISYTQFTSGLGVSKNTVIKALKSLEERGLIRVEKSFKANGASNFNRYSFSDFLINKSNEPRQLEGSADEPRTVQQMNGEGSSDEPRTVQQMNTQDKANTKQTRQDKAKLKEREKNTAAPGLSKAPAKKSAVKVPDDLPDGLSSSVLTEFIQYRGKMKKPMTQESVGRLVTKAVKCAKALEVTADDVLLETIDAGWIGFQLGWLQNRLGGDSSAAAGAPSRHTGFASRDYRKGISADGRF